MMTARELQGPLLGAQILVMKVAMDQLRLAPASLQVIWATIAPKQTVHF
jgi:hypothetical protein